MSNLDIILEQLQEIAVSPKKQMDLAEKEGKKVIGCFPIYTPEPLVYAAGMLPMGMWGGSISPFQVKRYIPAFCCPVMQANLEYGLTGAYEGVSGVMIPTVCDTFRCITQNWKAGINRIPMIPVAYPQNRDQAGVEFFVSELRTIRARLEEISGTAIIEEKLERAIGIYNEHSQTMREFVKLANDHLDIITPKVRHLVMKSAWFMDKQIHTALVGALNGELKRAKVYKGTEKRLLLTGIMVEPEGFFDIIEDNRMVVVADDLGQETRQYRTDIPDGPDGLTRISLQWAARTDSTAHSSHKERISEMTELARAVQADGVIACIMKFCDPEEYDYPLLKKAMQEIGIPVLYQEIDLQNSSLEQVKTRIQTFSETL